MRTKKSKKKLAVLDFETDSFSFGRVPQPFAADLYDGNEHFLFWGRDCIDKLALFLEGSDDEYIIYAHNGGKFDFYFLLIEGYIENPVRIINGRLVKAAMGKHELRDSYAIIPVPLSAYKKDDVDYSWFEEGEYQKHKKEIVEYLKSDCEYLYDMVDAFIERFGTKLTIGSAAMEKLMEMHPFQKANANHDERFRPFYFGGRVECFKTGILQGKFQVFDVNSMYPDRMKNVEHPCGSDYFITSNTTFFDKKTGELKGIYKKKPYFIRFTGKNRGALPVRTKNGLDFNIPEGEFFACSHEIKIALKHKLIDIEQVHEILIPNKTISFGAYVDIHIEEKIKCQKEGDKIGTIFAKLLLNAPYGKTGQNPANYMDFTIRLSGQPLPAGKTYKYLIKISGLEKEVEIVADDNEAAMEKLNRKYSEADFDVELLAITPIWRLFADYGTFEIWEKPSDSKSYFDVAIASSITSAARAVLLDAIHSATGLLYCDTDSLICEEFSGNINPHELGAWKHEATGDKIAIAGKKLYALFDGEECVKLATKGVRLTAEDIVRVASGETVIWENAAPSFSLQGDATFIKREVRMTA